MKTGLDNVVLPTLFTFVESGVDTESGGTILINIVDNYEQYGQHTNHHFFLLYNRTLVHLSGSYHKLGCSPKSEEALLYLARYSYEQP